MATPQNVQHTPKAPSAAGKPSTPPVVTAGVQASAAESAKVKKPKLPAVIRNAKKILRAINTIGRGADRFGGDAVIGDLLTKAHNLGVDALEHINKLPADYKLAKVAGSKTSLPELEKGAVVHITEKRAAEYEELGIVTEGLVVVKQMKNKVRCKDTSGAMAIIARAHLRSGAKRE